jgi:hypothetical protein
MYSYSFGAGTHGIWTCIFDDEFDLSNFIYHRFRTVLESSHGT